MDDKMWRTITINVDSADGLPDVRRFGRMKVYARVSIRGFDDDTAVETPTDEDGEVNPRWNFAIKYTVPESWIYPPQMEFVVRLYCRRSFGKDKYVGQSIVPLQILYDQGPSHAWDFPVLGTRNWNGTIKVFLANVSERVSAPEKKDRGSGAMEFLEVFAEGFLRGSVLFLSGA